MSQLPEAEESPDNSITSLMRRLETGLVRREERSTPSRPSRIFARKRSQARRRAGSLSSRVGEDLEPDEAEAAERS